MKLNMNLDLGASASAADWVKSSRVKEQDAKVEAKRLAELKQKQLQEDEDEMVEQSRSLYSSSDLKGLKVMHSTNDFEEGHEVILTLADSNILERDEEGKILGINEEGDVLENVLFADKDRRTDRENKKRRLNQPIYSALDDYEFQDGAATGSRAPLLPQYEKEKKAQAKFELGAGGVAAFDHNAYLAQTRADSIAALQQSLHSNVKEASDYYTAKEYTSFSKKKSKDKKSKSFRKKDAADEEAEAAAQGNQTSTDSGAIESKEMDVDDSEAKPKTAPAVKPPPPIKFQSLDLDEDDPDMAQALARSRRLALQKRAKDDEMQTDSTAAPTTNSQWGSVAAVGVADRGAEIARALAARAKEATNHSEHNDGPVGDDDVNVDGRLANGTLVFNSTTEFATRLQAQLSEKARAKTEALMRDLERTVAPKEDGHVGDSGKKHRVDHLGDASAVRDTASDAESGDSDEEGRARRAENSNIGGTMEDFAGLSDMEDSDMDVSDDEDANSQNGDADGDEQLDFVHRQPLVGKGMAATLALLKGTGELKKNEQLAGRAKDNRAFDPSASDHGVKLEYRDEFGRKLTQKEAFRQLSYRFHGYGPSQKKKEKRLKVRLQHMCILCTFIRKCRLLLFLLMMVVPQYLSKLCLHSTVYLTFFPCFLCLYLLMYRHWSCRTRLRHLARASWRGSGER